MEKRHREIQNVQFGEKRIIGNGTVRLALKERLEWFRS